MKLHHPLILIVLVLTLALGLPAAAQQQEHPEHPEESGEHAAALTADQLADAIAAYVEERSGDDGYMTVEDPETGEELKLKLDKVHRERLSRVAPDTYFACADFMSADGVVYDLDVFMKGSDPAALEFHDLSVHKVAGEPRYTWYEEDGVWKKKMAGEEGDEHPEGEEEHPEGEEEHPEGH